MREVASIALRRVDLSGSRPTVPEMVNAMAKSLSDVGLINPITVVPAKVYDSSIIVDGYRVVTGNHRVAAARALGWEEIEAFIIADEDRLENELREIDENLCRAELTPAQRAYSIKRRKEIWEIRHPEFQVGQIVPPETGYGKPPKQDKGFAADTSASTGHSKKDINRHISRAEALGDDLLEVTGTSLDKGVELDALKAMPEAERKDLIQKAKAGEKVSARKPVEQEASGALVSAVIRQMDICLMVLANTSIPVDELSDRFAAEFDPSDAAACSKALAILPLLNALGRIGDSLQVQVTA